MAKFKDLVIEAQEQGKDPEDYWLEKSLKKEEEKPLTHIQRLRIEKPEWFKEDPAPF